MTIDDNEAEGWHHVSGLESQQRGSDEGEASVSVETPELEGSWRGDKPWCCVAGLKALKKG